MASSQVYGLVLLIWIRSTIWGDSSCETYDTPTATQFISALKAQVVVCGLYKGHRKGGNCAADNAKLLSDFRHLFTGLHQQLDDTVT